MKIQVGRTYIDGDGDGTECRIVEYDGTKPHPFMDENGCRYTEDGAYCDTQYPELNLIREVADPEELREEIAELRRELEACRERIADLEEQRRYYDQRNFDPNHP